jgi:hypothetical protein
MRLSQARPRGQPTHQPQPRPALFGQNRARRDPRKLVERPPHLGADPDLESEETSWGDADDGEGDVIEHDALAHHLRVESEPALPQAVGDDRDRRRAFAIVRVGQGSTELSLHVERREEVARDLLGLDALGCPRAC